MNNDYLELSGNKAGPRFRAVMGAALVAAAIAGCASKPVIEDPQAQLKARAAQRWNALVAGDIKTAYSLMSPGSRQIVSYEGYIGSIRPGFWKKAEVLRAECTEPTVCEVVLEIQYDYRGTRVTTPLREPWALTDGQWWFVPK